MKELVIKKTHNTPFVSLDPKKGVLKIEGRAIPEDPGKFFKQIFEWLEEYYNNPRKQTQIDFKLEYVNSGSSKYFLEFMRIIKRKYESGHDTIINWYYEEDDESLQELGEHYQRTIPVPFKLIDYF